MKPQEDITIEYLTDKDTVTGTILNCLNEGLFIVDPEKKIIFWNKKAEQISGFSREEVMGINCSEILGGSSEDSIRLCKHQCPITRTLRTGEFTQCKMHSSHKAGWKIPLAINSGPLKNRKGRIIASIQLLRDNTNEETARLLEEKFKKIISEYVSSATFEEVMEKLAMGETTTVRTSDLTVLFLDIAGFTSFTEKNPPKEVIGTINDLFGVAANAIEELYGYIDKFIGDAIMAVFENADNAIYAAQKIIYYSLPGLNETRAKEGKTPINVRIGISSGLVIQGDIGTLKRKELTVIGDVVNVASRIQQVSEVNTISISEETLKRLKNASAFIFDKRIKVKGKEQPISIYKAI